jgi:ABC-type oligopeptide transport system substrate-binding subunit
MNASTFYSASFHAQQNDLPLTFYQGYTDSLQKFVFNLRNPPFDDPDYREALLMGIDWDTFNSVVYPNYDPYVDIFDGSDFEHPNQSSLAAMIPDYDPTTAADTVQGFIDDGARDYLNLLYSSTAAGGGSGEFLQTEYAKIGLTVNLLDKAGRDYRVFQNKNEMPDDPVAEPETWWDILPGTTGGSIRGIAPGALSGIFNSYYSDAGLHTAVDDFGTNLGGINDPQLDTWVLAAKGAQPSERHTIYNDIQEYILTNHLYHPTVIDMKFWAWSDDLKGLEDLALSWRNNEYSMSGLWLDR